MAKAMVSTVSPNASDTPSRPIPTLGNAAARTALPHPPRTSQKVPKKLRSVRFHSDLLISSNTLRASLAKTSAAAP